MKEPTRTLEGDLQSINLPQVLRTIAVRKSTGILTVQGVEDIVAVSCLNGHIVTADSLNQPHEEVLGEILVSHELVSKNDFDAVFMEYQGNGGNLGDLLEARGLLGREKFLECLRLQTYVLMARILTWQDGEFKFYGGDDVSYEKGVTPMSVDELLMRALADLGERSGVGGEIPRLDAIYRKVPWRGPVQVLGRDGTGEEGAGIWITDVQQVFLNHMDGQRSAFDIAHSLGAGRFRTLFSLHQLIQNKLIELVTSARIKIAASQTPGSTGIAHFGPVPSAPDDSHHLTLDELRNNDVLKELADVFADRAAAEDLLDRVGFPPSQRPASASKPIHYWNQVCRDIENGLIECGLEGLLAEALYLFPTNKAFGQLASTAESVVKRPEPQFQDDDTRELSQALKAARQRRAELEAHGHDTADVTETILDLSRKIREGGRLKAGDALLDGRFELLEPIGCGGFARIWKAYDERSRSLVAVKVLHAQYGEDRTRRERFFRGARHMARLQHSGIVRVIEQHCEDGGYYFFVMEYVGGEDLRRAVKANRLSMEERLKVILEVGEALSSAHDRGVIHRDVKPGNILLDLVKRPKLTDFDLVRAADTTGGTRTTGLGTFIYAAPEAMMDAKAAGKPADVFGLGMTAVFAFHGSDIPPEAMWELNEFVSNLKLPDGCQRVLQRAVARKLDERWSSVTEFCDALRDSFS